jgi:hypothetical protein
MAQEIEGARYGKILVLGLSRSEDGRVQNRDKIRAAAARKKCLPEL